ncbi:hypothetical protein GM415_01890 [Pseudodesulfovibrio cashew]|uniref:histidine kinase n=1 Tax=Pseudodesulfovibrio cashew TaxID=2678688 RepID=A0A6I6JCY3_9BACT|nr:HAMP domain-containing sensor histidine kinase [Pseudodesulfovibrio cashew]QGY38938.1 hypothetical protein GM415_01890 [Pseudodesulfovibrio cashew]
MSVNKKLTELALYAAILIGGSAVLLSLDAFEYLHDFVATHETYEVDELFILIPLLLFCLIIYSYRRSQDLVDRNRELINTSKKLQAAYDKIHTLSETREKFMSIACHELKGPLASVATALDLTKQAESEAEAEEMMSHARNNLKNLQLLVSDVLLFTSLSHDDSLADTATFSVRETLESVLRITIQPCRDKNLSLELNVDANVPDRAVGIEGWVRLICLNLVGNAIKYTKKGSISLHCGFRDATRPELILKVRDTGVGIPENKLELVFEPYEQAPLSEWEKREGLGLGLSVVKELVTRLDGTVSVESQVDVGSTFTVVLPIELQ